jgi:hypothetical protein
MIERTILAGSYIHFVRSGNTSVEARAAFISRSYFILTDLAQGD